MHYIQKTLNVLSILATGTIFIATANHAKALEPNISDNSSVDFSARAKAGIINRDDRSLGLVGSDTDSTMFAVIQPKVSFTMNESWSGFAFAEILSANDILDTNEDFAGNRTDDYASMRELWFDYSGLSRYPGEALRFGLERMREPSSLWWDRETLLARWLLNTTRLNATIGIGQRIDLVGTSDTKLDDLEQDRQRYFASLDYQWRYAHWLGLKIMHSVDNPEDTAVLPTQVNFQRQYTWFGISANNNYQTTGEELSNQYSIELMGLSGRAERLDLYDTTQDVSVNGWALDIGIRHRFSFEWPIFLGAHIAFASGSDGETEDKTYYQTGLQTNRNRFAATRSIFSRFGETARLDLSNVQIASVYLTELIGDHMEWSVIAHQFTRADDSQSIQVSGLSVDPRNGETDIGSELDFLFAYYHSAKRGMFANFSSKLRAGYFEAGEAYSHLPNESTYSVTFSLEKQF